MSQLYIRIARPPVFDTYPSPSRNFQSFQSIGFFARLPYTLVLSREISAVYRLLIVPFVAPCASRLLKDSFERVCTPRVMKFGIAEGSAVKFLPVAIPLLHHVDGD
jgi:hypothetical protein